MMDRGAEAMNRLGILLGAQGKTREAKRWLRKAAKWGSSDAAANLQALLNQTRIEPRDRQ
jgi:TPR repeat protein